MPIKISNSKILYIFLILTILFVIFKVQSQLFNKKIKSLDRKITVLNNYLLEDPLEKLVDHLKIYDVFDQNGPIKLIRIGKDYDGGYVVPEIALKQAQSLIGYGVADDISFEEQFSEIYNKHSYGFDCSTKYVEIKNKLTQFVPECIDSSDFIYASNPSSNTLKVTSFAQQLKNLDLEGQKLFIKMDIEGAEYNALPEILKYAQNITGMAVELHFSDGVGQVKKAVNLLSALERDFILVHIHGNNNAPKFTTVNSEGEIPRLIELSYINKSLISNYQISADQSHPSIIDMPVIKELPDSKFKILVKDRANNLQ